MSSQEHCRDDGSPSAPPTSTVTPATGAPPALQFPNSDNEETVDTIDTEGISPVRRPMADIDTIQQPQRWTSPTDSVVVTENSKRKQPRVDGDGTAPQEAPASTIPVRLPVINLPPQIFKLPNFHPSLRGKGYSNTFTTKNGGNVDIPEYTEEEREAFIINFQSEVNQRFSGRQTKNLREEMNGCDIRQCSRYRVEDIMASTATVPFTLAVKASLTTTAGTQLKKTKNAQTKNVPGACGNKWVAKLNKEEYVLLKCNLIQNDDHVSIKDRKVTTSDFHKWYEENRGFHVQFDGMPEDDNGSMFFSWRQLVENPMDYECWGDGYASAVLMNAYLGNRLEVERKARGKAVEDFKGELMASLNFRGEQAKEFFQRIDATIRERALDCVSTMQYFTDPIIRQDVISGWVEEARKTFPMLMLVLGTLRGVTEGASGFVQSKWNQVLFQLFLLARMANTHNLVWFSFIQSVANYGQGVPASAISNFFGNICSNTTRDRLMRSLTHDVMKKRIQCLSQFKCLILVFDNYQRGQHLRFQREMHSSSFLKGTTQVALQGWEWIDESWNEVFKAEYQSISYSNDLAIPSAPNMPELEAFRGRECELFAEVDRFELGSIDVNPNYSGERVDSLAYFIIFALLLGHVQRVFPTGQDIAFVEGNFKSEKINEFRRIAKKAGALFKAAKALPTNVVQCWNRFWGKRTPSLFLGLVGIADEKSMETGVLASDLLLKSGIIIDEGDGNYKLAPDYKTKRHIMVGDAKSVENVKKFIRETTGRELSLQQSSNTLQVFLDGLAQVMIIPGDWHAGLAMLQAIYSLWWPLLSVFKDLLGWKRIQKDVRGCYWQAVRLLELVVDELMRVLLFEFVSEHIDDIGEVEDGKEDEYVCKVVKQFYIHLKDLAFEDGRDGSNESDQWRKTWSIFIIMALDFKSFTEAYRNGDALMIEYAYKRFAPIWEMLGQHKYVARHWDQTETLYGHTFSFSRLMELRINRCVRRYDADNNEKRMVAHDENLEIWNSFFARFPMVRTLAAFVRQGYFVGLCKLCSIFVRDSFRVVADDSNVTTVPKSAKDPNTKMERQLIFEVLVKSNTHKYEPGRQFSSSIISNIDVTTNLKEDGKVVTKMKETDTVQNSCSLNILAAIDDGYRRHVLTDSGSGAEDNDNEEDDVVIGEEDDECVDGCAFESEWDDEVAAAAESNAASESSLPLSLQDLWTKGNNKFITGKVGEQRATEAARKQTKVAVQKEIYERANAQREASLQTEVGVERHLPPTSGMLATRALLARRKNERHARSQEDT